MMDKRVILMGLFVFILVGGLISITLFDRNHDTKTKTEVSVSEGKVKVSELDGDNSQTLSSNEKIAAESGNLGEKSASNSPPINSATTETSILPSSIRDASSAQSQPADERIRPVTKEFYWISGFVKSESGEPIPQTKVTANAKIDGKWNKISSQTNQEGYYAVELNHPGGYQVSVQPFDEYLGGSSKVDVTDEEKNVTQNITLLQAGLVVRGQVIDKVSSQPITGAKIELQGRYNETKPGQRTVKATSDANGEFTLRGIAEGMFSLLAKAENYVTFNPIDDHRSPNPLARYTINDRTQNKKILLKLEPGNAVTVRVMNSEKQPLEKATVNIFIDKVDYLRDNNGKTDANGELTLTRLPKGNAVAQVKKTGYGETISDIFQPGSIDSPTRLDIVMDAPTSVSGRVTTKDGSPVTDRRVFEINQTINQRLGRTGGGYRIVDEKTDINGNYQFTDLGSAVYKISVQSPENENRGWTEIASKTIELKAGESREGVDFVIDDEEEEANEEVQGKIVDQDSNPIEGASVSISVQVKNRSSSFGLYSSSTTDANGAFTVKGLKKGPKFHLSVTAKGYANYSKSYDMDGQSLIVTMKPAGSIQGLVIDKDSKGPVVGAQVSIDRSRSYRQTKFAITGEDGSFSLDNLDPASFRIYAQAEGYAKSESIDTQVQSGVMSENIIIELEAGMIFSGRLVNENQEPLPGAAIAFVSTMRNQLRNPGFNPYQEPVPLVDPALSGEDGSFQIKDISPRGDDLFIAHERYADRLFKVEPAMTDSSDPIIVVLSSGGGVEGLVIDAEGKPIPKTAIGCSSYPDNLFTYQTTTNEQGEYRLPHLPTAKYIVIKKGNPAQATSNSPINEREYKNVTVKDGKIARVDFGLGEGARVFGTVFKEGEPVAEARVLIESPPMTGLGLRLTAMTDVNGSYEFKGVPEGDYSIAFSLDTEQRYQNIYQSEGGQQLQITKERQEYQVDLSSRSYEITGIVKDADTGEILSGANIAPMHDITEIPGPGQYLSPTVTDEEGLFSIKPKQAKNYRFVVVKDGFTRQEFEVTISPESQPVHIELLLSKADTTLEAHVFYNNQPYDADQMMFATIENKFVQQLKHEKDPQQSGVFLLKGLSEGVVDLMGAGMSPSQMRYSFSRGVQIVKGQTSKVILNLIDVAVYQVTLKPPADEKIQGAYTYEVPDYPDLSYYPTPPVMPNNMIVILSLAGHHKVRLNVPGYRPVEFFPDELAQTGQQSNMKMFTLELQKM